MENIFWNWRFLTSLVPFEKNFLCVELFNFCLWIGISKNEYFSFESFETLNLKLSLTSSFEFENWFLLFRYLIFTPNWEILETNFTCAEQLFNFCLWIGLSKKQYFNFESFERLNLILFLNILIWIWELVFVVLIFNIYFKLRNTREIHQSMNQI